MGTVAVTALYGCIVPLDIVEAAGPRCGRPGRLYEFPDGQRAYVCDDHAAVMSPPGKLVHR